MISTITYFVKDMHCQSCPTLIKLNLMDIAGVNEVQASLETKSVTIIYDDKLVSQNDLINSIRNSGYTPQIAHA